MSKKIAHLEEVSLQRSPLMGSICTELVNTRNHLITIQALLKTHEKRLCELAVAVENLKRKKFLGLF